MSQQMDISGGMTPLLKIRSIRLEIQTYHSAQGYIKVLFPSKKVDKDLRIAYRHIRRITRRSQTPSSGKITTLVTFAHYFVKYRLGEEGMEVLMFLISKKIVHFLKSETEVIIDSPLAIWFRRNGE